MLYLGIDPGKNNMAFTLLENNKCIYACMFHNTISSLAEKDANLRVVFRKRIKTLFKKMGKGSAFIAERFVVRGFGAHLSELIGMMIGSISAIGEFYGVQENIVMSTTWKRAFKKKYDLDKLYKDAEKIRVPNHIVDSLLLATYLYHGKNFVKFSITNYRKNIKLAANMLDEGDKIKPKRKRKAKTNKKCVAPSKKKKK